MKAFCLLNHCLTINQINELFEKFAIEEILYPSVTLSKDWSQIPATINLNMDIIANVCKWLKHASNNDVLIIQGEFGSTFMLVDYALKKGLIPVYAVSKRIAKEERNGEIVNRAYVFKHVCFRKYEYFSY